MPNTMNTTIIGSWQDGKYKSEKVSYHDSKRYMKKLTPVLIADSTDDVKLPMAKPKDADVIVIRQ